jgi:hypothetical protein
MGFQLHKGISCTVGGRSYFGFWFNEIPQSVYCLAIHSSKHEMYTIRYRCWHLAEVRSIYS